MSSFSPIYALSGSIYSAAQTTRASIIIENMELEYNVGEVALSNISCSTSHFTSSLKDSEIYLNGNRVTGDYDGYIRLVNALSGLLSYEVKIPKEIYCIKYAENSHLITCGKGNVISVWNASMFEDKSDTNANENKQLELVHEIHSTHGYSIYCLEVISLEWTPFTSPCSSLKNNSGSNKCYIDTNKRNKNVQLIATAGRENLIRLWDMQEEVFCIEVPANSIIHSLTHLVLHDQEYSWAFDSTIQIHSIVLRLFAGSDNGSIYSWDIRADVHIKTNSTENCQNHTATSIKASFLNFQKKNTASMVPRQLGYDYLGHTNAVTALLIFDPPIPILTYSDNNSKSRKKEAKNLNKGPILVSSSRNIRDVRLWKADCNLQPGVKDTHTAYKGSSPFIDLFAPKENEALICKLFTDPSDSLISKSATTHMTSIKSLGILQHSNITDKKAHIDENKNTNINKNIITNTSTIESKKGKKKLSALNDANCHMLLTGGTGWDGRVCIWDVKQILKDVSWEKKKWFVLLAKQIRLISNNRSNSNTDDGSKSESDVVKYYDNTYSNNYTNDKSDKNINKNNTTNIDLEDKEREVKDITIFKALLTSIANHQDILLAVAEYLL